jgi:ketosteroid isomerase-like protein
LTREDVDRWLADYVEAWLTYDRDKIEALFAEEIVYRYHPWDEPISGRDALVESWLGERDEPGTYEASYSTVAVDGDVATATGTSTYFTEPGGPVDRIYDNCYVMRFDSEGRCNEFTEFFMKRPSA